MAGDGLQQRLTGPAPTAVLGAAGVGGPLGQRPLLRGRGELPAQLADRLLPSDELLAELTHEAVDGRRRIGAERPVLARGLRQRVLVQAVEGVPPPRCLGCRLEPPQHGAQRGVDGLR
ncbi:hypothetical protein [Kitasatospora sp. NPDC015120]|uniref:hypothetical protein n=1 Tax=Kitasatospora sp. NPDC015120 TaxID=3364023 RepID=UPI0036F46E74